MRTQTRRKKKLRSEFGEEVCEIVEGVTKIKKLNITLEENRAENIRKVIFATTKDLRVIILKLADRLQNMRTLKYKSEVKQKEIAKETLDIYAPIAYKLGISWVKSELEDLSLRFLNQKAYLFLKEKIRKTKEERDAAVEEAKKTLEQELAKQGIEAEIKGRAKSFYSIYKKMKDKNKSLNEIYDLTALRITTKSIDDCYTILGIIHGLWKPIPRHFEDYIANPKSNGYKSLHTVVVKEGKIFEIQIRTREMDIEAEHGIAAHWRYKGVDRDRLFDKKIGWLKEVLEWARESKSANDFIEHLKVDLFKDEICVFTPKGDPITLPENATPIDFAYSVHSSIGDHCSKAKVNSKIVSMDHPLQSGDIVEIIQSKEKCVSRHWLKFAKTNFARSKIRKELDLKIEHKSEQDEEGRPETEKIIDRIDYNGREGLKIAKCCALEFNKPIAGIKTKERKEKKISVHLKNCRNIVNEEKSRIVELKWKPEKEESRIKIEFNERTGIVSDILDAVSKFNIPVSSINTSFKSNISLCFVEFRISDKKRLYQTIDSLKKIPDIMRVDIV
ncbi:MAG: RelA/SpoT family protein [Candidatus Woesearchaeota archaeon]